MACTSGALRCRVTRLIGAQPATQAKADDAVRPIAAHIAEGDRESRVCYR